jgi:hypothetical protein
MVKKNAPGSGAFHFMAAFAKTGVAKCDNTRMN